MRFAVVGLEKGGEYFVLPRNTNIYCDIELAEKGESRHNEQYAMDAVQEYEAVVLMILCESICPN